MTTRKEREELATKHPSAHRMIWAEDYETDEVAMVAIYAHCHKNSEHIEWGDPEAYFQELFASCIGCYMAKKKMH